MAEYKCTPAFGGVIGRMPCWEERWFSSEFEYSIAYHAEEDEIYDQLAELEEKRPAFYDEQEDWFVYA